jgi:membrane protein DedA with SNARE-associated domain
LVALAGLQGALGVIAVPLVPVFYDDHFIWVILLRPTKEVLLTAGFLLREGDIGLPAVLAASIPLVVLGVWLMYALGFAYREEIQNADLPGLAGRILPPERIERLCKALGRHGTRFVLLGRLAVFPSTLVAAAAGASEVEPRRFFLADGIGALVSIAEVLVAGYLLGEARERAGLWLTFVGGAGLLLLLFLFGLRLRRE